jgi:hypothetical protein
MTAWMHEYIFQITSQITNKNQKTNLKFLINAFSLMWIVIIDICSLSAGKRRISVVIVCLKFDIFSCSHATMHSFS